MKVYKKELIGKLVSNKIILIFLFIIFYIVIQHQLKTNLVTTTHESEETDEHLPIISAHLGASMENVRQASTFTFREPKNMIDPVYVTEKPNIFRYTQKGLKFTLPKSGYVFIAAAAEHITHIEVSPRATSSSYEEVLDLINNLIEKFDKAGWKRDEKMNQRIKEPFDLIQILENVKILGSSTSALVKYWRNGEYTLYFIVQKMKTGYKPYRIIIFIDNKSIMRKYSDLSMSNAIRKIQADGN